MHDIYKLLDELEKHNPEECTEKVCSSCDDIFKLRSKTYSSESKKYFGICRDGRKLFFSTLKEIATFLHVSNETVRQAINKGEEVRCWTFDETIFN